jgi:pyruvate,water dikinase
MKWYQYLLRSKDEETKAAFSAIQKKYTHFLSLLEKNNQVLKAISDMEEKSQGEYLFDLNYLHSRLAEIREGIADIIEHMIFLGGERYRPLRERFALLDGEVEDLLPGKRPVLRDDFTIPFSGVSRGKSRSVGGKNAQLGEMIRLGLPVPDGFAVTAWAYRYFIETNSLQDRISRLLKPLNIKSYEELDRVSREIQHLVTASPVPEDLSAAIRKGLDELTRRTGASRFALRSSAVGEDTHFSFAGQYATFLNLPPDEGVIEKYREILASKFSPKAIYYLLSHGLMEGDLPMSVGCIVMVDATVSGVIYTRDPISPASDTLFIHSLWGLGRYVVDGTLTPDTFRVVRSDGTIDAELAPKTKRLVVAPDGGTREEPLPEPDQWRPSLEEGQIRILTELALKLEGHYGSPQDIEWVIDRRGNIFLLQTRPLRVTASQTRVESSPAAGPISAPVLFSGGTPVCPGAGGGPVYHAASTPDLSAVPVGAVLVAPSPFPGLIVVMDRINALVTEVGAAASHMATIARECRLPMLAGVKGSAKLPAGSPVTVDATRGFIYAGVQQDLIAARRPEYELFKDTEIIDLLRSVLAKISPLNLVNPSDTGFRPENCRTFHDLARFAHQKGMEEMFASAQKMENKDRLGRKLKSSIPLSVDIIYIDQPPPGPQEPRNLVEEEIASLPMKSFWEGIKDLGWPKTPATDLKGFMTVMANDMTRGSVPEFSENSYAILSSEYMLLSLRMGYHFSTIEALCTDTESKNYIRLQYKEGGAPLDRRARRIKILVALLEQMGFESSSQGDFLDALLTYRSRPALLSRLRQLGRISMMTKQLDMALSNDAIAQWYVEDLKKKLKWKDEEEDYA